MSYSRWSHSNWYSFWSTSSPDDIKEEQVLSLWYNAESTLDFTYKELKSFGKYKLKILYPDASDADIKEALNIIKWFIDDVDKEFAEDVLK